MAAESVHRAAWEVARHQHWVIRRDQLRALGFTRAAIRHRIDRGRLHPLWPNTFAVGRPELSRAMSEADKRDLVDPAALRQAAEGAAGAGARRVRDILDRHTFALTDSELERLFMLLIERAGLPKPQTQAHVNGFRVDFFWPGLGLVVEADGLRYHRTAAQQTRDRIRDQRHVAAGLRTLRSTQHQIAHEPEHVVGILRAVASG